MCYFLYGGVNEEFAIEDLEKIKNKSDFKFYLVSKLQENKKYFPGITNNICDCGTPIDSGNEKNKIITQEEKKELWDIADYIHNLRKLRNIKHVWVQKMWYDDETERELTVHIDDIDIIPFLTNLKEKHVYKIQLFKNY